MIISDPKTVKIQHDSILQPSFEALMEKNDQFKNAYKNNAIMQLINSDLIR